MVPKADGHSTRPTRQQQEGSVLSVQLPILSQGSIQGSSLRPNIPQIPQGKCMASQSQQRNMDRSPKAGHQESPKRKSTSREHPYLTTMPVYQTVPAAPRVPPCDSVLAFPNRHQNDPSAHF